MTAPLGPRRSSGLLDFNPPRDAEPSATAEVPNGDQNGDGTKPSVLSKLQKWADYPSVGNPVNPTKFLPMKTPMSLEIISNWSLEQPPKHSLTVPELLSSQDVTGRCVGMIIDLANHECLYAEDLPGSLEYTHIQLVAKVLPPFEAINAVAAAAAEFWARRPGDYIAIHCAYGFNRTGFVVCSYLCQECGLTVPEALESFAQARPPGVKHGKFVDELYARYGSTTGNNTGTTSTDGTEQLGRLQENGREERNQISNITAAEIITTAAAIDGQGDGDLPPPPPPPLASLAGCGTPLSGLLSLHLRKGSVTSNKSTSSAPAGGSFSRRSIDGGSGRGGGGYGAWKEERANSTTTASDEEYCPSIASLSLLSGASIGSPANSLPIVSSLSPSSSAKGSLLPRDGDGGGGSRRSSSRSLLAVAEFREEKHKASGAEKDPAPVEKERPDLDVDDVIEPCTSGQWSEMAQQVDGKSLMRRETSLGLAKALHEDFGVHDSTPSQLTPSPLMEKVGTEAAARAEEEAGKQRIGNLIVEDQVGQLKLESLDGGSQVQQFAFATLHQEDQSIKGQARTPLSSQYDSQYKVDTDVPSSTPPSATSVQQQPWSAQGFSLDNKISPAPSRVSSGILPPSASDPYMPRNMSFESDCHSLGFNAREAITQLRSQQGGTGVCASFNRQYSVASDLDSTLWETSEDEVGEDGGASGKPKVKSRRQLPQEQRRDCSLM